MIIYLIIFFILLIFYLLNVNFKKFFHINTKKMILILG